MTSDQSKPRVHAGRPQEVPMGKSFDESSPAQAAAAVIGERAMQYGKTLPKGQRMAVHVSGHPMAFLMSRISATSTEHVLIEGTDDNGQAVEVIARPEALVVSFSAKAVS